MVSNNTSPVPFSKELSLEAFLGYIHEACKMTPDGCHIDQTNHLLFVYDEIMGGFYENWWLLEGRYIGTARTLEHFELMADGVTTVMLDRPGHAKHRLPVLGELWLVTPEIIRNLDSKRYLNTQKTDRKKIDVRLRDGTEVTDYEPYQLLKAWTYIGNNVWWSKQRDTHIDLHRLQPKPMPEKPNLTCLSL